MPEDPAVERPRLGSPMFYKVVGCATLLLLTVGASIGFLCYQFWSWGRVDASIRRALVQVRPGMPVRELLGVASRSLEDERGQALYPSDIVAYERCSSSSVLPAASHSKGGSGVYILARRGITVTPAELDSIADRLKPCSDFLLMYSVGFSNLSMGISLGEDGRVKSFLPFKGAAK